ncbi:MAG: zinc ribbon domain-containing protein [Myxococcota bacterium]
MSDVSGGTQFPCAACGAPAMAWDAAAQRMRCPYCGHTAAVQGGAVGVPAEHSVDAAQSQSQTGYGTAVRVVQCQTCGATVSFGGADISTHCNFCGSQHVLEQDSQRNVIRPESLVPFAVNTETAKQKFDAWIGSGWFRPSDLKAMAKADGLAGIYIPFWTFDAWVDSQWRAEAGYHYYETEVVVENGTKMQKQVQKTRWQPAHGHRRDHHDDVLVVASRGLPRKLADRLATFDTSQLRPYDPNFLAGWQAEEYAVGLDDAWGHAAQKIESAQRGKCMNDVPGDTHRGLQVQNRYSDKSYKHILLPLWISSYQYSGKAYRFLVNGQTGEVSGEAPTSWIKVALFVLLLVVLIGGCLFGMTALSDG